MFDMTGHQATLQQRRSILIAATFVLSTCPLASAQCDIIQLDAGSYHTIALSADGSVWTNGANQYGQLGQGVGFPTTPLPLQVTGLGGPAVQVASGYHHCLVLLADGTVWSWGYNDRGQLGNGGIANGFVPSQVPGLTSVIAIAGACNFSLALLADGSVWAWGWNVYGQLGTGDTLDRLYPVPVSNLMDAVEISAGCRHALARKSDGTLMAWGVNQHGEIGDTTVTNRTIPVPVVAASSTPGIPLSGVVGVACGGSHNLAILSDGTLRAWGWNHYGQLGNGSTGSPTGPGTTAPIPVNGISGALSVEAGDAHSYTLLADGSVWAWGYGGLGQVGGTFAWNNAYPAQVPFLDGILRLASGVHNGFATRQDGTHWAWGSNNYGQLGDGTSSNQAYPVQILQNECNHPPIADAGSDETWNEGELVTLDGSASSDLDDDPLTFHWLQLPGGSAVTLNLADPIRPTFTVQMVPAGGETLTFQLVVDDGTDQSEPSLVSVTIKNVNNLPVASADGPEQVGEYATVHLDGSASHDVDGEVLSFFWHQTGGYPVTLLPDTCAESPYFVAPCVGPTGELLTFTLVVSDGIDISALDTVTVLVLNVNQPPAADAGPDLTRDEASLVTLSALASNDPDDDTLSYSWLQTGGVWVTLSDPSAAEPTFSAPVVSANETLEFVLTVSDGLLSSSDTVLVTIRDSNGPPACANARPSVNLLWPPNHRLVPVSVLGISDPESAALQVTIDLIMQDEPTNGLGDGDTNHDAVVVGETVLLRAERAGSGNGRFYTIHFTATDELGQSCSGTVQVVVPKRKKKKDVPVDDGELYLSL